MTNGRVWAVGLLATAAFFLLAGGWALALPVNGTYDEDQHIVRAYAVATGQWLPTGRALDAAGLPAEAFEAPRSLLPENAACTWQPRPPQPASCLRLVTDSGNTWMPSQAARYSPVYYLATGLPLWLSPDSTGVLGSRLVSALLSAALLGTAVAIGFRLGNRLLLGAIVLVCTPTVLNLIGAVNPNGLEISAGILLFVALLALFRGTPEDDSPGETWLLAAAGLASGLLLTVRQQSGPVLFVGIVGACLLVARRQRLAGLIRRRRTLALLGAPIVGGIGFALGWLLYSRVTEVERLPGRGLPYDVGEILRRLPGERLQFYVDQVVARFGYGETGVSPLLIVAWYALFALLVGPALWLGCARLRIAIIGVFLGCLLMMIEREIHFVPTYGWYSHSRYVLPLGVGVVLLAAFSTRLTTRLRDRGWLGWPVTVLIVATTPLDLYALIRVMSRFQVGVESSFDPLGGSWHPPLGSATALGVTALGILGLIGAAIVAVPPVTDDKPSD